MSIASKFPALNAAMCGGVFLAALAVAPASAGVRDDVRDLQQRMTQAEQSLEGQRAATLRIGELEREIQSLTGRIEQLTFQLDQANMRLDAISAALASGGPAAATTGGAGGEWIGGEWVPGDMAADVPVARSGPVDLTAGGAGQAAPAPAGAASAAPAPDDVTLPLDPAAAFDYASQFLLKGDYPRAKSAFGLYLQAFPNHTRTPDAQFRLGEIHMALSENAAAADAFIAHIRDYPNDPRAVEAYLKLGSAFARLEKPGEACTVFKTMKAKFPNAAGPVVQRADLEMARIDCQ